MRGEWWSREVLKLNAHLAPLAAECCPLQLRIGCEDKEPSALWESGNFVGLATKVINGCVPVISATPPASLHSSPAAGGGEQERDSVLRVGVRVVLVEILEKGTCPPPPFALRKVPSVFWAPL